MWLLLPFLVIPVIEISLFILVGGAIGLWPTIGIVIASAFLGSWLVRSQGARELAELRQSFQDMRDPTEPLANGAMIILAGALLVTPGFFTDALGLALLMPPVRRFVFTKLRARIRMQSFTTTQSSSDGRTERSTTVIEGDFVDVTTDKRATHQPSGWTKH